MPPSIGIELFGPYLMLTGVDKMPLDLSIRVLFSGILLSTRRLGEGLLEEPDSKDSMNGR